MKGSKERGVLGFEQQSPFAHSCLSGELARDIEKLSELEPSVKLEVPDDCDVELSSLFGALTTDQQERPSSLSTAILQVVDATVRWWILFFWLDLV